MVNTKWFKLPIGVVWCCLMFLGHSPRFSGWSSLKNDKAHFTVTDPTWLNPQKGSSTKNQQIVVLFESKWEVDGPDVLNLPGKNNEKSQRIQLSSKWDIGSMNHKTGIQVEIQDYRGIFLSCAICAQMISGWRLLVVKMQPQVLAMSALGWMKHHLSGGKHHCLTL